MWKRASDSYFELLLPCFAWRMMLFWFILHKQLILLLVRSFGASPIIIFIDEDQKWPAKLFVAGVAPRLDVLLVSPKLTCALFTTTLNFNWDANANHWCECLLLVFDHLALKYHSETYISTSWWMYFTWLLKTSFVFWKRNRDCLNFAKINSEDFVFFMRVLHQFFCLTKEMMARLALVNEPMWPKKPIETSSPSREYCILLIFGSWLHFFPDARSKTSSEAAFTCSQASTSSLREE